MMNEAYLLMRGECGKLGMIHAGIKKWATGAGDPGVQNCERSSPKKLFSKKQQAVTCLAVGVMRQIGRRNCGRPAKWR
jgi:hypothetical protein